MPTTETTTNRSRTPTGHPIYRHGQRALPVEMKHGPELHEDAVRLHEAHARHARALGDEETPVEPKDGQTGREHVFTVSIRSL